MDHLQEYSRMKVNKVTGGIELKVGFRVDTGPFSEGWIVNKSNERMELQPHF